GFEVESALTAGEALFKAARRTPAVILLDWMLPDLSGIEICRRLRQDKSLRDTGIIMFTALSDAENRISGFEAGAADYIIKPYNMREVVLRVRALCRRLCEQQAARATPPSGDELSWRGLRVNLSTYDVLIGEGPVSLRPFEFKLLVVLMSEPGRVFSRD